MREATTGENEKNGDSKTVILKVYMHCEACAMKTERALKGYEGVEIVIVDLKNNNVTVKGKVDPQKLCEFVEKKLGKKKTEVVYSGDEKKADEKSSCEKKTEDDKQQEIIRVEQKVQMHCEACAIHLKKTILKMKGVESAEADFKNQKCSVWGTMDPKDLVDHIHKKARKRAQVIPQKKSEKGGEKKGDGDGNQTDRGASSVPRYVIQNCHPPQLFSDDNPNACSLT